ncbi:MAG: TIGR00730 family Rossman fold protein [Acidimicrobiia bacterium]|jgi:hypothetical protein
MICVFAGSARGVSESDLALAARVGAALAASGTPVVYGGGSTGCMGAMADAALDAGAHVVGVIPRGLFHREEVHQGVDLVEVESLHERKQVMLELANAFVVLPGGLGTLDEVGEVLTWAQLGIHAKPTVFVDPDGFWAGLLAWIDTAVERGYVPAPSRDFFTTVPDADGVLPAIAGFAPPPAVRGPLSREQT